MERYASTHGIFFVNCLKNNNPQNSIDTLAARQATRTTLCNAAVTANAVATATEAMIWRKAGDNSIDASEHE